ncbi:MAG TPA: substrate-binding domain-containing protein [Verrucomicrobiae bacterium]
MAARLLSVLVQLSILLIFVSGCAHEGEKVVIYTSQDQVFAQPILAKFTEHTGIRVATVYDSEAVKTVGLANRLLQERDHPQCDVFWSNEELRTRQLAARDVLRETNGWASFGFRSRRIVINTNLVPLNFAPKTIAGLTNGVWRGKVCLAYPLFGTTATHFLALRELWGAPAWENWCRALAANQPLLVDGNSVVVKQVARGEAALGLTDSDDIASGLEEGFPIVALPMSDDMLLIPNTVAVIRHAPHPAAAERLFEYLQTKPVLDALLKAHALEGAVPSKKSGLYPDWGNLLANLEPATTKLREIFLR